MQNLLKKLNGNINRNLHKNYSTLHQKLFQLVSSTSYKYYQSLQWQRLVDQSKQKRYLYSQDSSQRFMIRPLIQQDAIKLLKMRQTLINQKYHDKSFRSQIGKDVFLKRLKREQAFGQNIFCYDREDNENAGMLGLSYPINNKKGSNQMKAGYVQKKYRKMGIFRKMISYYSTKSAQQGATDLYLELYKNHYQQFLKKNGFVDGREIMLRLDGNLPFQKHLKAKQNIKIIEPNSFIQTIQISSNSKQEFCFHKQPFDDSFNQTLCFIVNNPLRVHNITNYVVLYDNAKQRRIMGIVAYYDLIGDWFGNQRKVPILAIGNQFRKDERASKAIIATMIDHLMTNNLSFKWHMVVFILPKEDEVQLRKVTSGLQGWDTEIYSMFF